MKIISRVLLLFFMYIYWFQGVKYMQTERHDRDISPFSTTNSEHGTHDPHMWTNNTPNPPREEEEKQIKKQKKTTKEKQTESYLIRCKRVIRHDVREMVLYTLRTGNVPWDLSLRQSIEAVP